MQGYNLRIQIERPSVTDDEVGGSVTTYATIVDNIPARLQAQLLDEDIVEVTGGRQTAKAFRVTCQPSSLDIRENDRMSIISPSRHAYYSQYFRVEKVNHGNYFPKNYVILTVSLSEEAHS